MVSRAQREPAAFAPLYEAYFDAVYRYCYHRLGDWGAAEDAASEVFTNALAALPRFRVDGRAGSFRSWLFTIAHNVVANQYRFHARRSFAALEAADELPDAAPLPEDAALAAEAHRMLLDVLMCLTDEQRRVVELRLAGLTDVEIARVLGRGHGAVRALQYRALVRLRSVLAPGNQEFVDA
jgi:RNA polymerase sigma-70 factor (ECF subfamily)